MHRLASMSSTDCEEGLRRPATTSPIPRGLSESTNDNTSNRMGGPDGCQPPHSVAGSHTHQEITKRPTHSRCPSLRCNLTPDPTHSDTTSAHRDINQREERPRPTAVKTAREGSLGVEGERPAAGRPALAGISVHPHDAGRRRVDWDGALGLRRSLPCERAVVAAGARGASVCSLCCCNWGRAWGFGMTASPTHRAVLW